MIFEILANGRDLPAVAHCASGNGIETETVTANELHGAEHAEFWDALVRVMLGFAEYQRTTTRTIPLIALDKRPAS